MKSPAFVIIVSIKPLLYALTRIEYANITKHTVGNIFFIPSVKPSKASDNLILYTIFIINANSISIIIVII